MNTKVLENLDKNIKRYRLLRNLTQEKLAEKLDVSVAFLSRIERGSSLISLKNNKTFFCIC